MTNQRHRRRRALAVAAFCLAVVVPSFAGALELDSVTEAVEPVTEVLEPVTDPVEDSLEPVTDAVEPVTDTLDPITNTVTDTVDPVTDTVTDTVDPVTDTVTDTVDPVTDTVDPVTDTVTDVVDPVTDTVTDPVTDVVGPVRDVVDPVTDTVQDPVTDVVGPVTDTVTDPLPDDPSVINDPAAPTGSGTTNDGGRGGSSPAVQSRSNAVIGPDGARSDVRDALGVPVLSGAGVPAGAAAAQDTVATAARIPGDSPLATAGRVLRQVAEAFRFPLLVGAAVLLFLAVQSRLDRRDPKLAAPVADEELQFA